MSVSFEAKADAYVVLKFDRPLADMYICNLQPFSFSKQTKILMTKLFLSVEMRSRMILSHLVILH